MADPECNCTAVVCILIALATTCTADHCGLAEDSFTISIYSYVPTTIPPKIHCVVGYRYRYR